MDGNEAAAYASYAFTEVAAIYPITPASPMAEHIDSWATMGKKNIFGEPVKLVEMQSEGGAISAVHGAMETGALTSTYTASQGLLLMIPTMYRIAGHMRPGVIHVASRSVALHAYSIFAEHSDVMACRQTGYAILASGSVQESMDLAAVAHLASIRSSVPFLHFFDGFRTSHEIQKIELLDYDELKTLMDWEALAKFRSNALNPEHPLIHISGQTPDVFFQSREVCTLRYETVPDAVQHYMDELGKLTGRSYKIFQYYGAEDAEVVLIAMGSVSGAIRETVDFFNRNGKKVGFIEVHLYRPFSISHFQQALPSTAKKLVVLDRTKENGALADPLMADVCAAVADADLSVKVLGGRFGLGGKDTDPTSIKAVFDNAFSAEPKNHFTVGIHDDLTNSSLPLGPQLDLAPAGQISCKFWGLGSDGTVGANKNSIKIIGDNTNLYVQAFFEYDGKKSGGVTRSHLRLGSSPIQSEYYVKHADFVACHKASFLPEYDICSEIKPHGAFLLNCPWDEEQLDEMLPIAYRRYFAENDIRLFTIDASTIARELGLGNRSNTVLQAAFFKITGILPLDDAVKYMRQSAFETYGKKGEDVVEKNYAAIDKGLSELKEIKVPARWKNVREPEGSSPDPVLPTYVRELMNPILAMKGNSLPVSAFENWGDGSMPTGTSKYQRRGIAVSVPRWEAEKCLQCNMCSLVCPHAAIRPFLLTEAEKETVGEGLKTIPASGKNLKGYAFRVQVDPLDCLGCGSCVSVCPAKEKALTMMPLDSQRGEMRIWDQLVNLPERRPMGMDTIKGSQFAKPLLEFSGACAGCGETPYVKLLTQLYGDRMYIASATGCSLVWATDYPVGPYTTNSRGFGPTMSNSLFENNGEFGLGMKLGEERLRDSLKASAACLRDGAASEELRRAAKEWLENYDSSEKTRETSDALLAALRNCREREEAREEIDILLTNADKLTKKSVWILGGDGWAYDIGYGGLDHILSMDRDVNILVVDTEAYSNTGGQASKATSKGAVAQFAAGGKRSRKKDLGMMAMTYENVYVAQVAMGANPAQLLKSIREAESYHGPSLIIAYAPCQCHGIRQGMGRSQDEMKRAVESGYWKLYRYDPRRRAEGKNPFILDSPAPSMPLQEFMDGETRFTSLKQTLPEIVPLLASEASRDAEEQYKKYKRITD